MNPVEINGWGSEQEAAYKSCEDQLKSCEKCGQEFAAWGDITICEPCEEEEIIQIITQNTGD